MLRDVEMGCPSYASCSYYHTDNDGGLWCDERCKPFDKEKKLCTLVTRLEQEKYQCADNEQKEIWNKAIKKAILLVRTNFD